MTDRRLTPVADFRAGFVSFVGRPNVGKSTLTNALVGEKVAITSSKPQTTRRAIRGIVHAPTGQLIIVDTPGMHRPRTLLGERLNDVVQTTLGDVDVIGFCLPADEKIGPGDRFINEQLDAFPRAKKVAIVTKIDAVSKDRGRRAAARGERAARLGGDHPGVGDQPHPARRPRRPSSSSCCRSSPPLYPDDAVTDETPRGRASPSSSARPRSRACSDELPHSLAVTIDDMVERDDKDLLEIYANLFVERDSQKGIVIGHRGERLQEVGARARARRSSRSSAGRCSCRCGSRSPRSGSATRSSSAASASERPRLRLPVVRRMIARSIRGREDVRGRRADGAADAVRWWGDLPPPRALPGRRRRRRRPRRSAWSALPFDLHAIAISHRWSRSAWSSRRRSGACRPGSPWRIAWVDGRVRDAHAVDAAGLEPRDLRGALRHRPPTAARGSVAGPRLGRRRCRARHVLRHVRAARAVRRRPRRHATSPTSSGSCSRSASRSSGSWRSLGLPWVGGQLARTRYAARDEPRGAAHRRARGGARRGRRRPRRARGGAEPSATSPSSRSATGSRATCTTSSPTRSPSSSPRPTARATPPEAIPAVEEALVTIASTAREALGDVRVLLAQLRHSQGDGAAAGARRPRPARRADARGRAHDRPCASSGDAARCSAATASSPSTGSCRSRSPTSSATATRREPVDVLFDWRPDDLHRRDRQLP